MNLFRSIVCIVLDGVGIGEAPDADAYGDAGSDSVGNTSRRVGGLRLPNLARMGFGNVAEIVGVPGSDRPAACVGRLCPAASGKDSIAGHWELAGCVLDTPLATFPHGLPPETLAELEARIDRKVLGNHAASGTAIIEEFGAEHVATGRPIVYTSQDSVFQIAAHKEVMPLDELYRVCTIARELLDRHRVGRVIARPFHGEPGGFYRTGERRDFSIEPPSRTVLDALSDAGIPVAAIGKVADLFAGRGIAETVVTRDNQEGMHEIRRAVATRKRGFVFANLVDFDTMWGHRNDARAYALGLEEFDSYLGSLFASIDRGTLLIVTSDHGNDPTTPSTDHSREFVPLVVWHPGLDRPGSLGTRDTLADVGRTVAENFGVAAGFPGASFLAEV